MTVPHQSHAEQWSDDVQWVLSDAWVLAATRVSGTMQERAGLFDLVAACDAVNQLIVSRRELEHAMSMLVGSDLMVADEYGIAITEAGRELVARAGRSVVPAGGQGAHRVHHANRIEALFRVLSQVVPSPIPFELDPRTYEAACLEYRHTRWNELRKTERRY